jgi:predicted alpha/beta superfamily hydrolase
MNKLFLFGFLFLFSAGLFAQTTESDTIYSSQTNDKYVIIVRKPAGFNPSKKYHHVYMTDGTIGMGDYVLGKSRSWAATIPSNCIIIAIGHLGNWNDKRNRDLIPTDVTKNPEKNFGKADKFYLFLKNELIPSIDKKLPNRRLRAFIGHSLGGLFCLYTVFKDDNLFDKHYALSPSCWANQNEIDKIEEAYSKTHTSLNADVMIYVGGLEFLNKVLFSTRSFYKTVDERKYKGLKIVKTEFADANHFSLRKPAVDKIFEQLKEM